eukprot:TRINITY_DN1617_c0_g1_i2.p1 TRINITY_DN1617_c0_g1~~TRINITY_DN1617_c0_g1_i2.p1  ORF type:complete len:168 (+),score=69.00 TRINITY_DN1617_c0_g1_i2:186-689(+)
MDPERPEIPEEELLSFDLGKRLEELRQMFENDIVAPLLAQNAKVQREKEEFEREKAKHRDPDARMDDLVRLDIGGKTFEMLRKHLCSDKESMLAAIFNGDFKLERAKNGCIFINRDYTFFHIIKSYLEGKPYELPTDPLDVKRLLHECKYYKLKKLEQEIERQRDRK